LAVAEGELPPVGFRDQISVESRRRHFSPMYQTTDAGTPESEPG
jgi:hypothetical protein